VRAAVGRCSTSRLDRRRQFFCHRGRPVGSIEHDDLFKPPGDYEAWEHDDNPRFADLPATGRLAYLYPLVLERTSSARYVRFVCTPQAGRGMGLSELQVFDHVDVTAWPAEIKLPGYAGT
jgi:hypothetical protein